VNDPSGIGVTFLEFVVTTGSVWCSLPSLRECLAHAPVEIKIEFTFS
jgi:hypothetical protein